MPSVSKEVDDSMPTGAAGTDACEILTSLGTRYRRRYLNLAP
jgi:hypothetical protein